MDSASTFVLATIYDSGIHIQDFTSFIYLFCFVLCFVVSVNRCVLLLSAALLVQISGAVLASR